MHSNEKLIQCYLQALQQQDLPTMQMCYHKSITYEDDLFRELKKGDVPAMWEMRFAENPVWEVEFKDIQASNDWGRVHWTLTYGHTKNGKPKRRHIVARFTFYEGKILYHSDAFNLYNWVKENQGAWWRFLIWFSPLQYFLRAGAHRKLQRFKETHQLQFA